MPTIDEKRKAVLEQAIRDMGNYGVKLRKPEELPDLTSPEIMKRKRKDLSLFNWRNWKKWRTTMISPKHHIKIQDCPQREGLFLPKKLTSEWEKPSAESN